MRTLLWFAHPADTWRLRLAEQVADAVLTTAPGSYPHPNSKLHCIGQGIDVEPSATRLRPPAPFAFSRWARTSPDKGFRLLIDAVARVTASAMPVELRNPSDRPTTPTERRIERARGSHRGGRVDSPGDILPGVPHADVPGLLPRD